MPHRSAIFGKSKQLIKTFLRFILRLYRERLLLSCSKLSTYRYVKQGCGVVAVLFRLRLRFRLRPRWIFSRMRPVQALSALSDRLSPWLAAVYHPVETSRNCGVWSAVYLERERTPVTRQRVFTNIAQWRHRGTQF